MKILVIGTDRKMFEEGSAVLGRQIKYAGLFERTDIIVSSLKSLGLQPKTYSNLNIYPTNSYSRFLYFIDAFIAAKRLERPDIISAQDPFESGFAAYLISRYFGAPLYLQVHTDFLSPYFFKDTWLNKIRFYLARFLIKRASVVRVVTERIRRSIIDSGLKSGDAINVLPVFVDTGKISNSPILTDLHKKYPQFERIVLMASRITKEKNIDLAIEAMAELVKSRRDIGLVIVGDGPERGSLERKVKSEKLETNIVFENWSSDLPSYYKTADLFLLTSNYEGYGMTVIEALSAGLPVVMSDVGLAGEVLIHTKNGLIFPVGDLRVLTETLTLFFKDTALRLSVEDGAKNTNLGYNEEAYLDKYKKSFNF